MFIAPPSSNFLSVACLLRVLKKENSKLLTASAVFLPVHPMMVSVIQTRMMEGVAHTLLTQAFVQTPHLQGIHLLCLMTCIGSTHLGTSNTPHQSENESHLILSIASIRKGACKRQVQD
ncbi:hypothetical protein Ahy_A04g020963 isoform D [Arachis hypogaea]|uniref:Uncharacterized protein n=1 Tax=Arachis hypogaea TaxID=3818 RepID=A0A445DIY8_ARAHY|nr:hypothetical protein Ahy_A04g020963 isoform D [Arachis hypogaea]